MLDFLEMKNSGDIFYLYSDRFEIEFRRFHRVYKVYRNKDFSLYSHINLSFDYDYVNNFLVIQQKNQIVILQRQTKDFQLIQVLQTSSVKVMIDKSFLIIFTDAHIIYYDLIYQKTNNIWQHSYSPAVLF